MSTDTISGMDASAFANVEASDAPRENVIPDEPIIPDHTKSKREKAERPSPSARNITKRKGYFVEPLTKMYGGIGLMVMPFDKVCGQAVIQSAENCARSLDELAYQNDAVRKVLIALTETTAIGTVIAAHAPILITVLIHHMPAVKDRIGAAATMFNVSVPVENETESQE